MVRRCDGKLQPPVSRGLVPNKQISRLDQREYQNDPVMMSMQRVHVDIVQEILGKSSDDPWQCLTPKTDSLNIPLEMNKTVSCYI